MADSDRYGVEPALHPLESAIHHAAGNDLGHATLYQCRGSTEKEFTKNDSRQESEGQDSR
ncbi:hypothetical protein [Phocaeicola vulgatus]|uniref:hypothetical protein n=1 Tax=Phocaeicola vulgatus TaxID=821 RepID=UPI0016292677|nr:hypothetical protein [Phocaeicola vulgatus]